MNPCQYNVYTRIVGQRAKSLRAKFLTLTDAANYAYEMSVGKFNHCEQPTKLVVFNLLTGKNEFVYHDGVLVKRRQK